VMEEIGMRPPHSRGNCLQRHSLRAIFDQEGTRSFESASAAFVWRQAFTSY